MVKCGLQARVNFDIHSDHMSRKKEAYLYSMILIEEIMINAITKMWIVFWAEVWIYYSMRKKGR